MTDIIDISYICGHHLTIQYGKDSGFDLFVTRDFELVLKRHYKTYRGAKARYNKECNHYRAKEQASWFE